MSSMAISPASTAWDDTEILYSLTDAANRAASAEEIYEPALDAITRALRLDRASILLRDGHGVMRFVAWRGLSEGYRRAVEGHSPWSADVTEYSPIVSSDVIADPEYHALWSVFRGEDIGALAFVPLVHRGRLLGKFMVYARAPRGWTAHEMQLAVTIASHVSQSVARSQLHAELEDANRAKDEFIRLLGHELRNPLAPIVAALHLMHVQEPDRMGRERAVIERQVKHLSRLVDDLLDVTRIARGIIELRRGPVSVARAVLAAADGIGPLVDERAQHLVVDLAVPASLEIDADEERLAQIVGNLLHNASKYTDAGGNIRLSASATDTEVRIGVEDDGRGIDAALLPRVFDRFHQGPRIDPATRSGLGIGLSIVRNLAELHGGRVEARSGGPGLGSHFIVTLPRTAPSRPAAAPEAAAAESPARPRRVLVVDDNVDAADLVAEALALEGHDVRVAYDAPAALHVVSAFAPDVALLDLGLPGMDGYELAERLRAAPGLGDVHLVAVTGFGSGADRARALASGFAEHLTKPVDIGALLRVVRG